VTVVGGESTFDDVAVTVYDANVNVAPVADAGPDQSVLVGSYVRLDAGASFDPNAGDTLSFDWEQVSGPAVTPEENPDGVAYFQAAAEGSYVFRVTVSDGSLASSDSVVVATRAATPQTNGDTSPVDLPSLAVLPNLVSPLDPSAFVVGPAELAGEELPVFTMSGLLVGHVAMEEGEGVARGGLETLGALDPGLYLVVAEIDGLLYRARFVVRTE
jgi:hypothetical protein